jgi:hypothetical protein
MCTRRCRAIVVARLCELGRESSASGDVLIRVRTQDKIQTAHVEGSEHAQPARTWKTMSGIDAEMAHKKNQKSSKGFWRKADSSTRTLATRVE